MLDADTADYALSPDAAAQLLVEIDAWCAATGVDPITLGQLAVDQGAWVGLLRLRGSARARRAAMIRQFMSYWPDGVPGDLRPALRVAVRDQMRAVRDTELQRAAPKAVRRIYGHERHGAAMPPIMNNLPPQIDRDPCFYCGVRGDIGCVHRAAAVHG